jgi:hypothetical protein
MRWKWSKLLFSIQPMKAVQLLVLYLLACLLLAALAAPPYASSTILASTSMTAAGPFAAPNAYFYPVFRVTLVNPPQERSAPFFGPLLSKDQATVLSWPIALGSIAEGAGNQSVQHLETLAASYAALHQERWSDPGSRNEKFPGEANGGLWMVSFSGGFTPKRLPPGIKPPVYNRLVVYIDMHGGGIIGIHMGGGDLDRSANADHKRP